VVEAVIAIVSVVASAAVAIAVAVAAHRAEAARLRYQISSERVDELRGVLDDAAMVLRGALFEMNGIVSLLDQGLEQALGGGPTVNDVYATFQERHWEAGRLAERIALRLGPGNELTRVYRVGVDSCDAFFDVWGERWNGHEWDDELSRRANQAGGDGERAYQRFLAASAAMVGPGLGDTQS
jgi:hypothetical protein